MDNSASKTTRFRDKVRAAMIHVLDIQDGLLMGLYLVLLRWLSVPSDARIRTGASSRNSRFGRFNSRLGGANSRLGLLREFASKGLI